MGITYRLTAYGKSRRPLPGVNWRDLTAEEYEAACAANPGMDQQGYFELAVEEEPSPSSSSRRQTKAEPVTAEENTDER